MTCSKKGDIVATFGYGRTGPSVLSGRQSWLATNPHHSNSDRWGGGGTCKGERRLTMKKQYKNSVTHNSRSERRLPIVDGNSNNLFLSNSLSRMWVLSLKKTTNHQPPHTGLSTLYIDQFQMAKIANR
jgi:hypothetical protein